MYKDLSTFDLIADILQAVLNSLFYVLLMKGRLKLRNGWVVGILGAMYTVALVCKYQTSLPVSLYCVIVLAFALTQLMLTERGSWINGYTCYVMWMTLYNVLVIVFTALAYIVYSVVTTGQVDWYVKSENGAGMYIVMCVAIAISTVLAYLFINKIKDSIFDLRNPFKTVFFICIPIEGLLAFLAKGFSSQMAEYSDSASGVLALLDLFTSLMVFVALVGIIVYRLRRRLVVQRELEVVIDESQKKYEELQQKKEELEELVHDSGKEI